MKNIIASLLTALAVLVAGAVVSAPAAQAAGWRQHCVTKAEFHRVHRGMSPRRVARIFDTHGSFGGGGAGGFSRVYRQCRMPHGLVNLAAVEYSTMHWPPARMDGWKRWNAITGLD